jgi:hypothetical protein
VTDSIIPPDIVGASARAVAGSNPITTTCRVSHRTGDRLVELSDIEAARIAMPLTVEGIKEKVCRHLREFTRS